jgi:hypothetical protein
MSVVEDYVFRPTKHERAREANIHPRINLPLEGTRLVGDGMRDAQADVPST